MATEIKWYGHSCFRLRHKKGVVGTDPYHKEIGCSLPSFRVDIVTVSHEHPHHNHVAGVKGEAKVLSGPGEYEISGIFVKGIAAGGRRKGASAIGRNIAYLFDFGDLTVCHLGNLNHVLDEDMEDIDILLTPVGGGAGLNAAKAAEVVSLLQPRMVIPMHYKVPKMEVALAPVSGFLKEMGMAETVTLDTLSVDRKDLPEQTRVVVLKCDL
jgi:L-ascorbate metabolism protein UlaG (beta-lactamase superfamily)